MQPFFAATYVHIFVIWNFTRLERFFFNSIWWGPLSSNVLIIYAVYWSLGRRGYFGVSNVGLVLDAMGTYGRKPSINTNHFSDNFIAFLSPRVFAALAIDLEILKDLTNSYRSVWIISSAFQDFQVFETILAKITLPSIYSDSLR